MTHLARALGPGVPGRGVGGAVGPAAVGAVGAGRAGAGVDVALRVARPPARVGVEVGAA